MIPINAMKAKNIKTVISVQALQRPLFSGVLAQFLRVKLQEASGEGWRVKVRLENKKKLGLSAPVTSPSRQLMHSTHDWHFQSCQLFEPVGRLV